MCHKKVALRRKISVLIGNRTLDIGLNVCAFANAMTVYSVVLTGMQHNFSSTLTTYRKQMKVRSYLLQ